MSVDLRESGGHMRSIYFVLSTSAILGVGVPYTVAAADLPAKAPIYKAPAPAPLYNWTGFYFGGNIGEHGPISR